MNTNRNSPRKSGPVTYLALLFIGVAAGLTWMTLSHSESTPAARPTPAPAHQPSRTASADAPPERSTSSRAAPALPARQWKLGDSFVYQVDSTRQVAIGKPTTPVRPPTGG